MVAGADAGTNGCHVRRMRNRVCALGARVLTGTGQSNARRGARDKMAGKSANKRSSLFDYVADAQRDSAANKFCERTVIRDEPSVEEFFVSRLLHDLGYKDTEIRPKESLAELTISRGRSKEKYRPDYALVCGDKPRWLIEAKGPEENVDEWAYQGAGYALGLNRQYRGENPVRYYAVTNGLELKVWKWDESEPELTLSFADFFDDSPKYVAMRALLSASVVRRGWREKIAKPDTVVLRKPSVEEVKRLFKNCHRLIWKAEHMNPQPAFFAFVKVMFVKLWEDRKLHEDPELGPLIRAGQPIPRDRLVFSTQWIESLESRGVENPVDGTLFRHLTETLAEAVAKREKKPIFESDEKTRLHPGTAKQVVSRLETFDMFGIDEDLNGRLFETFLSATMRGEALGQYFTPRSIVKLMERLASPVAGRRHVDRVLDACCGTGGFLIECLTDMRNQIRGNTSLRQTEVAALQEKVANEAIFGIDAGQDPPLARIARINMYLHGDGGSRIYAADSLDKTVSSSVGDDPQAKLELEELRSLLGKVGEGFDIVLTNPPFSMDYSSNLPNEKRILEQYDLASHGYEGTLKQRASLTSRIMFLERYADLLKPGGKLITVIDDATLSTKKYAFARSFIRKRFVVRAVISLPGDAFQRVGARAKTSILYLIKRKEGEVEQPNIFMMESSYIGLDDVPAKTPKSKADEARARAEQDTEDILKAFGKFLEGKKGPYLVPSAAISDRLDVKSCLPRLDDVSVKWSSEGFELVPLGDIVDHITGEDFNPNDAANTGFTFLRVRYDGLPEEGETRLGGEITYKNVQRPAENDVVVSNIELVHGAVCVLPKDLEHTIVSSEYTVLRVTDKRFQPWFLWGYLRSLEVRARMLSIATGISRHRIEWDFLKELPVPLVNPAFQKRVSKQYKEAVISLREAERERREADRSLSDLLDLENEWAVERLRAAKPPK